MSQVIVTDDVLNAKREATRQQEAKISREDQFSTWRRSDITGKDPILSLIGYALMPIVLLWTVLLGVMVFALEFSKYIFKFLGRLIGGTRNLITGR